MRVQRLQDPDMGKAARRSAPEGKANRRRFARALGRVFQRRERAISGSRAHWPI
jgi:hypothetical protein